MASDTPAQQIRKRLFKNKPAVVGLMVIALAVVCAIFGMAFMPDKTPNANDGAVQIQKMLPGFEATFIKIRKNAEDIDANLLERMFVGVESDYIIEPIIDYQIDEDSITVSLFGREDYFYKYLLLNVVRPLQSGATVSKSESGGEVFYDYINVKGEQERESRSALLKEFEENHIEHRY